MSNLDLNVLHEGTEISSGTLRPQDLLRALDRSWNHALSLAAVRNIRYIPAGEQRTDDDAEITRALADLMGAHTNFKRGKLRPVLMMFDLLEVEPEVYENLINVENLSERACDLVDEMCTALEDFVPAGCYVGMHEGDGALLGVWRAEV